MKKLMIFAVVIVVFLFNINMNDKKNINTTNIESSEKIMDNDNEEINEVLEVLTETKEAIETNETNSKPKAVETQKETVIKEEPREVEVECVYIPKSDKEFCHTDSVYQVEPGEDINNYLANAVIEIKKDLLADQGGEFCKTEKITEGYKIYFCNKTGKKIEEVTVIDKGIDSDGIRYLDAVKYKYLDF